jgi:hypothetical protein
MPSRRFPKPWSVEPMPSGYRIFDANGIVLAHVYGQPDGVIAVSDTRLTNDEARRISKLISRLPELVELERRAQSPVACSPSSCSKARGTRQKVRIYTTHTPPRSAKRGSLLG